MSISDVRPTPARPRPFARSLHCSLWCHSMVTTFGDFRERYDTAGQRYRAGPMPHTPRHAHRVSVKCVLSFTTVLFASRSNDRLIHRRPLVFCGIKEAMKSDRPTHRAPSIFRSKDLPLSPLMWLLLREPPSSSPRTKKGDQRKFGR